MCLIILGESYLTEQFSQITHYLVEHLIHNDTIISVQIQLQVFKDQLNSILPAFCGVDILVPFPFSNPSIHWGDITLYNLEVKILMLFSSWIIAKSKKSILTFWETFWSQILAL